MLHIVETGWDNAKIWLTHVHGSEGPNPLTSLMRSAAEIKDHNLTPVIEIKQTPSGLEWNHGPYGQNFGLEIC